MQARKAELDNLVKQKESFEINKEAELQRLKQLENEVESKTQKIENSCRYFLQTI
jgi:hypothetical protein